MFWEKGTGAVTFQELETGFAKDKFRKSIKNNQKTGGKPNKTQLLILKPRSDYFQ